MRKIKQGKFLVIFWMREKRVEVKILKIKKVEYEEFHVQFSGDFYKGIQKCRRYPGGKWFRCVAKEWKPAEVCSDVKNQLEEMYEIETVWKTLDLDSE